MATDFYQQHEADVVAQVSMARTFSVHRVRAPAGQYVCETRAFVLPRVLFYYLLPLVRVGF